MDQERRCRYGCGCVATLKITTWNTEAGPLYECPHCWSITETYLGGRYGTYKLEFLNRHSKCKYTPLEYIDDPTLRSQREEGGTFYTTFFKEWNYTPGLKLDIQESIITKTTIITQRETITKISKE